MSLRHVAACLALAGAASLTLGCGAKRISECNKLITVVNEEGQKLGASPSSDAAGLKKMADDLDASAGKVAAAEVTLPELVKFRDDYAQVMKDVAKGLRDSAAGAEGADLGKATAALKIVTDAGTRSSKLVGEINGFCQGK